MAYTTIDKGSKYFNTVLYTGTSASNAITVGFKPDFTWIRWRGADNHQLQDAVRGVTKALGTNITNAESTESPSITSFDTNGFTLGIDTGAYNFTGRSYVSWNWLGANTTVSNTSGTITSTVSANTTSGFSIVSWAGSGANATVGHGLGTTPAMIITKSRTSGTDGWYTLHQKSSSNDGNGLFLNNTASVYNRVSDLGGTGITTLSSSTFTINQGSATFLNMSSQNYIAYCFADVKGFSKFGSYTGNGSSDGTFIYTGFKPAFVLWKVSSTTEGWYLVDNKRDTYNPSGNYLLPNTSAAESGTNSILDLLSNGFKFRSSGGAWWNGSGSTYIYMAFAENPFVSSKGLPCTAR